MIYTIGHRPKFHQVVRNGYFPTCLERKHFTDYLLSGMWPVSAQVAGNFESTGFFPQFICDKKSGSHVLANISSVTSLF